MKLLVFILNIFILAVHVNGDALDEDYGYVDVRPGAHMFWVVYHTELPGDWSDHPLILWLQGGPGSSGVGFGNFKELGPYDTKGNLREGRWTQKANVMFVDNPVGTGYSYVDDFDLLCSDNIQVADDLLTLLKEVFAEYPDMEKMPFFVYAESYGGKMTADFSIALDKTIWAGEMRCNFQGIAMGDSWISPMDSVNTWGEYLYRTGFVNKVGKAQIDKAAARTQKAVDAEKWIQATVEWEHTEVVIMNVTDGVDMYNVLTPDSSRYAMTVVQTPSSIKKYFFMRPEIRNLYFRHIVPFTESLTDFMNGPQKNSWNIPDNVVWNSQAGYVFNSLSGDFMKPVVDSVASLLKDSNIHVSVYTGDLDLICDTPGTYMWIDKMDYPQKTGFNAASRIALVVANYPNNAAYVQRFERFSVFTLLRSGHMVPIDVPDMTLQMIDMITKYGEEAVRNKTQTSKNEANVYLKAEPVATHSGQSRNTEKVVKPENQEIEQRQEKKENEIKEEAESKENQQKVKQTKQEIRPQKKQVEIKKGNSKPTHYEEIEVDKDMSKILKQKIFEKKQNIRAYKLARLNAKLKVTKRLPKQSSQFVEHTKAREVKAYVSQIHQKKVHPVGTQLHD